MSSRAMWARYEVAFVEGSRRVVRVVGAKASSERVHHNMA